MPGIRPALLTQGRPRWSCGLTWTRAAFCPAVLALALASCRARTVPVELVPANSEPSPERRVPTSPPSSPAFATPSLASLTPSVCPLEAAPALADPSCPPAPPPSHCLIFTSFPSAPAASAAFVRLAAREGIQVEREGSLLSASMSDQAITSVFGAKVVYRLLPGSASNSMSPGPRCTASLEHVRIPARFAQYISAVSVGHQICE